MKQETKIRIFGVLMAISSISYMGCYIVDNEFKKEPVNQVYVHSYETDENRFYNGEILYPDMVHADTLRVINANFLNEMIIDNKYNVESDGDIYDVLQEGCVNYLDYEDYMNVVNK